MIRNTKQSYLFLRFLGNKRNDLLKAPNVVSDTSSHRWRHAQSLVDSRGL